MLGEPAAFAAPAAVPLCHSRQRSQLCRIFIPTLFDAHCDQDKAISRQPLLAARCRNIGYVSCSPQPTQNHVVFQDSAVVSVWSLSCSELWMKCVLEALGSTQESLELPVKFSLLQSGSGSVLPCKTVQSAPANLPRTTWNSPS